MPIMLVSAVLLWPIFSNLHISRLEGISLLILFSGVMFFMVRMGLRDAKLDRSQLNEFKEHIEKAKTGFRNSLPGSAVLILLGLSGLALGAHISVNAAVYIGARAGLSNAVIGMSIVAVGTSLPELMTCVVAAFKGHDDISIGNLVGSNIFNTLFVVGISGSVRSYDISSQFIGADYWIMIAISAAFLLLGLFKRRISRKSGFMLLASYIGYMTYILVT